MDFMTQVARVPGKHMTTREQIYDYFQHRFEGETKWRSELAREIQPYTRGKDGKPQSYASVRRRFEGNRLHSKLTPKTQAEYEALGRDLPAMRPERGYHVKGVVCIAIADYPCETRPWDFKVTGENADDLYQHGSLQRLVNLYFGELPEEEEPTAELCEDEDECKSKLRVTALSEKGARHLPNIDGSR